MASSSAPPPPPPLFPFPRCFFLLISLTLLLVTVSGVTHETTLKGVDIENPALDVTPSPIYGQLSSHDSKDVLLCERVKVSGLSRLKLESYASSFRVIVTPSALIPERLHGRIQVCFHRNASLGLCHCDKDVWTTVQKGFWRSFMSPYEERYVDLRFMGEIPGSVRVSVEEDSRPLRLLWLAVGFVLLLLAPIVSNWVPFYYSTAMAVGVFLVILILLFQGMKLLPAGRKNLLYLSIYGSVLGAGTFVLHHVSMLVNSILVNFGLSEEMHNPVLVLVLVLIVLAGAALGCWAVKKFVITNNGSVDIGVAQFVKWAMRILATTFVFQSTLDIPLAMTSLVCSYTICFLIAKLNRSHPVLKSYSNSGNRWHQGSVHATANRAEFLSRSGSPGGKMWNTPRSVSAWSNSPVKGLISPSSRSSTTDQEDYYSTFHKTSRRKKFTKKQWEDFTQESTQKAVAEWAASPEVTNWLIENANRIRLLPSDNDSEEIMGSESDSTDENVIASGKGFSLFNW